MTNEQIIEVVCKEFNVTQEQLKSKSREFPFPVTRQLIVYFLREVKTVTYQAIGKMLNRHHTTCINSYDKVCDYIGCGRNNYINDAYLNISQKINELNKVKHVI